jgi:hypothetical protein
VPCGMSSQSGPHGSRTTIHPGPPTGRSWRAALSPSTSSPACARWDIFHRLFAKSILLVVGKEATRACDNLNLCAGLKAGIEGAIHALHDSWEEDLNGPPTEPEAAELPEDPSVEGDTHPELPELHTQHMDPEDGEEEETDPYVVLLVDATNGVNELGRKAALWTVRHKWAAGARFAFNCYRHSVTLILRRPGRPNCYTLQSQEGVTQRDPLAMVRSPTSVIAPQRRSLRPSPTRSGSELGSTLTSTPPAPRRPPARPECRETWQRKQPATLPRPSLCPSTAGRSGRAKRTAPG